MEQTFKNENVSYSPAFKKQATGLVFDGSYVSILHVHEGKGM